MGKLKSWREMIPLMKAIYERNCVGCCWHIVLDDDNIEDGHVEYCINYAAEKGHQDCIALGPLMLSASRTQRLRASRSYYGQRS
jgi:hypothetical protein